MATFYDTLEEIRREMLEAQMSPAELATHEIASRVNSLRMEMIDLVSIAKGFDTPEAMCLANEWQVLDEIASKAMWLASFGEAKTHKPGLRMIRGKRS